MIFDFSTVLAQDAKEGLLSVLWWGIPTVVVVSLWEMFFVQLRQHIAGDRPQ